MLKKNKGFTLVEILAVIVIISILATAVIAAISIYVKQGKDAYNKDLEDQAVLVSKNYFSDNPGLLTNDYVTFKELAAKGYLSKDFIDAHDNSCMEKSYVKVDPEKTGDLNPNNAKYYACIICDNDGYNNTEDNKNCNLEQKQITITLDNTDATTEGTKSVTATLGSPSISPSQIDLPQRVYTVSGFETADERNSSSATISSQETLTSTYTFKGWYTETSEGSKVINNSSTPAYVASVSGYTDKDGNWIKEEDTTLYAKWSPASVTLPSITKTGYTCGWTTSEIGTKISYGSGATYTPTANATMYAVCEANAYTVNVAVKNGKVDSASKSVNFGSDETFTISPSTGYGSPTVSCINGQSGSISGNTLTVSTVTNETTCTVTYKANAYTITLNNSSATKAGTTSVTATYNSSSISPSTITLPKREYTVSGFGTSSSRNSSGATISSTSTLTSTYAFNGWYTKTSGGSRVINNSSTPAYIASVSGYTSSGKWIKEGGATLYAQWSSQSVTLPTIKKSGYICGWTTSEAGTTISYASGATYTPTANATMYAVCEANTYTVNVVVQNGTINGDARKTVEYSKSTSFSITPNTGAQNGVVSCTNGQTGAYESNTLTVSNVTSDTTCTLKFTTLATTLYKDGTFIINEQLSNRSANIEKHGAVVNEYEALSDTQSYSFSSNPKVLWHNERDSILKVEIGQTINPTNTSYWFYGCEKMTAGDFTNLNASSVTNMSYMFRGAGYNATTVNLLGLNSWNTSSVTNMSSMFWESGYSATTWSIGDLSSWDTSNVTSMSAMFYYAGYSATTFDIGNLSDWNTSNVTDMSSMFWESGYSATTWSIGDLSSWNTSKVKEIDYMFWYAGYSSTVFNIGDLSKWDTSSVTTMSRMFGNAGYRATTFNIGDLSNWDTSNVTDMIAMFTYSGYKATTWTIGNLSNWNTSRVTNMASMFYGAGYSSTNWSIGNLSNWNTSSVTSMNSMFYSAGYSATTFDISFIQNWDTSSVTNMGHMFASAGRSATTWTIGDLSSWNTSSVTDMDNMFASAGYSAKTWAIGDLSGWDTSSVTDMVGMFLNAGYSATTFDIGNLSGWDTSSVTSMRNMFADAGYSATTFSIGDLSSWDTSSVTDMSVMFADAGYNATTFELNLSNWDTSNVTNMHRMFNSAGYNAQTFNIGDLSKWDTSNVTSMYRMFTDAGYNATKFSIGNLSSWNTKSVERMDSMFYYAGSKATWSLNCSGWNVNNVTNYDNFNIGVTSKVTPPVWVN